MLHIASVFGEWMVTKTSWNFRVNKEKGGKLFTIMDGLKFDDMVQMVNEDFGIDRLIHELELSYVLPKSMMRNMPKDTPPVFVTSDRQLDTFCEICRSVPLRLCISVKHSNIEYQNPGLDFREISGECGENMTGKSSDNVVIHDSNDEAEVGFASFQDGNVLQKGQCFKSKSDLTWKIRMLTIEGKFRITVYKSDTKLLVVKCVDKSCKWKVRASKKKAPCEYFWVTKYIDKHTCLSRNIGPPKASSKLMSKLLLENFGSAGLSMKPDLISTTLKKRYGIDSKYWKTWKSRENAREEVLGSPESSYAQLPVYIHKIQKANPDTIACLDIDDQKRFKYLFFSFAASAKGYKFMRKVVVVDGTFLKAKYGGILLVATAQDGDSHIYPIAFGIVDSENDAAWEWFFIKLRSVVSDDPRLVIISDRHLSIGNAIEKVYPLAHRGICTYHLEKNVITKSGGKKVVRLVRTASKAYTTAEFNAIFAEIRHHNQKLGVYLEEANVQLWSRAYFLGDKYDITTSNSAESLNALFRKPRELPIGPLLEAIRNTLTRWFFYRRESAAKLSSSLTPKVEKELQKRCNLSYTFDVQPINQHEFQVFDGSQFYLVDLQQMTCTCRVFDIEKIPCKHDAKAAMSRGINPGLLVHQYYTKSHLYAAYSESIRPIDELSDLSEIPSAIVGQICLPPDVQRQPGRPKKRRYEGFGEQVMRKKARKTCSRCRRSGHNRTTCDFGF